MQRRTAHKAVLLALTLLASSLLAACTGEAVEPPLPTLPVDDTAEQTTIPETEAQPEERILQIPVSHIGDTTGYVSLPDLTSGKPTAMEFFLIPFDERDFVSAFTLSIAPIPEMETAPEIEADLQVVHIKNLWDETVTILYLLEYTYINEDGNRVVITQLSDVSFRGYLKQGKHHVIVSNGFLYYDHTQADRVQRHQVESLQRAAERMKDIYASGNYASYELTLLYSSVNGVEIINQPIEEIPDFEFALTYEYGYPD